jgi:hypothetical protein
VLVGAPIALSHFACQPNSGLYQPRSCLFCHHCVIACAIGGINNLVLPLLCADPITQRRNRIGNSDHVLTVPTRSARFCWPARLLPRSCYADRANWLANPCTLVLRSICRMTARGPWMSSVRRYVSPRLLIPCKFVLPPDECCLGTKPSQAASCRPFAKFFASPTEATRALAVIGPIPRISSSLRDSVLARCQCWI